MPFIDKLDELLKTTRPEKLLEQKRIGMFPVNFARGMNWTGKVIILDEAQNCTQKEIITILTRMGRGSKCFVLADPMQTDLCSNKIGAFEEISKIFSDDDSFYMGVKTFKFTEDDIMRSRLTRFIVKKLKESKQKKTDENIRRWGSE
jgi:phosphate starvation-inducible PhoH-like protein